MNEPKLKFPPGSLITHLLFKRSQQTVLKKSVRSHLDLEIGDYVIVRSVGPGVIMMEKLKLDEINPEQELQYVRMLSLQTALPKRQSLGDK